LLGRRKTCPYDVDVAVGVSVDVGVSVGVRFNGDGPKVAVGDGVCVDVAGGVAEGAKAAVGMINSVLVGEGIVVG